MLIVAPANCCGMTTLTKDKAKIDMLYAKGYDSAVAIKEFVNA